MSGEVSNSAKSNDLTLSRQYTMGSDELTQDNLDEKKIGQPEAEKKDVKSPIFQRQYTMGEDELTEDTRKASNPIVISGLLMRQDTLIETGIPEESYVEANSSGEPSLKKQNVHSSSIVEQRVKRQKSEEEEVKMQVKTPDLKLKHIVPALIRANSTSDDDILGKTPRAFVNEEDLKHKHNSFNIQNVFIDSPPFSPPSVPLEPAERITRQESWKEDVSDSGWRAW